MQELSQEQHEYILQFRHPEKMLAELPGANLDVMAELENMTPEAYRAARQKFAERAHEAAEELLEGAETTDLVDQLPFLAGQTVVGLGDSITDDLQSWLEILRHLWAIHRPDEEVTFVNRGYSGDTTTHAICRFGQVVADEPDWIICMLGTNDVRLHGESPTKTLVSTSETESNLEMLRHYAATETDAHWVWLTPTPVIEEQIRDHWRMSDLSLMWHNADLEAIREAILNRNEPAVDLSDVFTTPPDPLFFLPDGLHPSLAGQKKITRAVIRTLSAL